MKRYFYIALIGVITLIGGLLIYQRHELLKYRSLYNKELQNVEAYQVANSGLENSIREYQMTIDDLIVSKDSVDQKLLEVVKELKIKDSKIEYLQYQTAVATKRDTVSFTDTLFVKDIHIDTLLCDSWYQLQLGLHYPSEIVVSPTFNSEKYVVINTKKVYNRKPSWFFLIRWFQKKYTVVEVNVEEKSPYIVSKENKFIKIIK